MNCPSCAKPVADGATDCPACGIVFAKWEQRRARELEAAREEKSRALAALEAGAAAAPAVDPRMGRAIAAVIVTVWMAAVGLYLRSLATTRRKPPMGVPTGEFAEMRDPKTGEIVKLPVRRLDPAPPRKR